MGGLGQEIEGGRASVAESVVSASVRVNARKRPPPSDLKRLFSGKENSEFFRSDKKPC